MRLGDERRGDRVLHGRADAGQQDEAAEGGVALGRRQQGEGEAGKNGAGREQRALADALGEHARRQLQTRQGARIGHAQGADLHVGEAEGLRPDRQQHIEGVGNAIVHEMGGAGGCQRAALGVDGLDGRRPTLVLANAHTTLRPAVPTTL